MELRFSAHALEDFFDPGPRHFVPHRLHERKAFGHAEGEVVAGHWCPLADSGRPPERLASYGVG